MSEDEPEQRLVNLLFAFEKADTEFIVLEVCTLDFNLLRRERIELFGLAQVVSVFGYLGHDGIAREKVQRDGRLVDQLLDRIGVTESLLQIAYLQADARQQCQRDRALRGYVQRLKTVMSLRTQSARFPQSSELVMPLRTVQFD